MAGMGGVYYLDRLIAKKKKVLKELLQISAAQRTDPEYQVKLITIGKALACYRQSILDELGVIDQGSKYVGRQPEGLQPDQIDVFSAGG